LSIDETTRASGNIAQSGLTLQGINSGSFDAERVRHEGCLFQPPQGGNTEGREGGRKLHRMLETGLDETDFICLRKPTRVRQRKNECARASRERARRAILTQFSSRVLGHDHRLFPPFWPWRRDPNASDPSLGLGAVTIPGNLWRRAECLRALATFPSAMTLSVIDTAFRDPLAR